MSRCSYPPDPPGLEHEENRTDARLDLRGITAKWCAIPCWARVLKMVAGADLPHVLLADRGRLQEARYYAEHVNMVATLCVAFVMSLPISLGIHHQVRTGRSTLDLDTFGLGTSTLVRYPDLVYSVPVAAGLRRGPLSLACPDLMPLVRMALQHVLCEPRRFAVVCAAAGVSRWLPAPASRLRRLSHLGRPLP